MKMCRFCGTKKKDDEFASSKYNKSCPEGYCKKCLQKSPEELSKLNLYKLARSRAKEEKVDFNIEIEDIVVPDKCPVLGIPMGSVYLDRHENSKGYVKGNVWVISSRAFRAKLGYTVEELEKIVKWLS